MLWQGAQWRILKNFNVQNEECHNYDLKHFMFWSFFSWQLENYAFGTCLDLSHFLESWAKYIKFKFLPLVRLDKTPPTCLRLGPGGSKS
jgi:hypothetical protein